MKRMLAIVMLFGMMSLTAFAESGADTYTAKCKMCHGADGAPPAAMAKSMGIRDLKSDDVQKQSDADLKTVIEKGKGKMPAFAGKLTPAQIDDVTKYVRSLKK
jgi:mono/diheme cytochrome c family protein